MFFSFAKPQVSMRRLPGLFGTLSGSLALLLAFALLALFFFDPARHAFYPQCYFHKTTGWLCPGCGGLRAVHQLLHGHLTAAFRLNALFVGSLPFLAWFGARHTIAWLRKQPAPDLHLVWAWIGLAVLAVFAVVRNLPFAHDIWLAP
jgi:hypothetical protein